MICSVPRCGEPTPFPPYTVADSMRPLCEKCYDELSAFYERAKAAVRANDSFPSRKRRSDE